ncbi:MAG: trigger factor [Campylobacteraceae bacterium]|nr:trigger factor [Campylobacteraceae bacterium]
MEFNAKKVDEANAIVTSTIAVEDINKNYDKIAKQASKQMNISGFRKGKVPVAVVKKMHGEKLLQDAESDSLRDLFQASLKELKLTTEDIIGEPAVSKFDKKEDGSIEVEVKFAVKPSIELGDYKALLPEVKTKKVLAKDVDERLDTMAKQSAPLEKLKRKRAAKDGDFTLIDFEGFVDEVAFDGGKAENYSLEIGSGSFIPGFEEQIIGMKYEEEKNVVVTFPESYQSKDLAGKEATFKVTLHEIQEKVAAELNDEFAKKMLPSEDDVTMETLKDKIKEQIKTEKTSVYYRDELKPAYLDTLVKELTFALPQSVVDQEINMALNNKVKAYSEEDIKKLQENPSEVEKLRDELKDDASDSVKATFIVDALAKAEGVDVTDQEVSQVIYYEAMQSGQNPQDALKTYQEKGYLPAIKMSMIEDKVMTKLLDEKSGK